MANEKETTNSDILGAVNEFASKVDERFDGIDQRFDGVDQRFDKVEQRLDRVEATMVTKDYLDDKLSDMKGDIVVLMRKEDQKLAKLIDIL